MAEGHQCRHCYEDDRLPAQATRSCAAVRVPVSSAITEYYSNVAVAGNGSFARERRG